MHDSESDTFVYHTWPEKISYMLKEIGVSSIAKEVGTTVFERVSDYYGRYFSQTPRMFTNLGCVELENSNIDAIQIIQKG